MKMDTVEMNGESTDCSADELLCYTLHSGVKIPKLGLWNAMQKNTSRGLASGLGCGYRHITVDSKQDFDKTLGPTLASFLKDNKLKRDDVFISLLLEITGLGNAANIRHLVKQRLHVIDCEYFDMIILHKEGAKQTSDSLRQRNATNSIWKSLEKLATDAVTRCLALSNFRQDEIESMLSSCQIQPDVLWLSEPVKKFGWRDVNHARSYCQYRKMYLGVLYRVDRPESEWVRAIHPVLGTTSKRCGHSPIQIFQRYHIQRNILVSIATDIKSLDLSFKVYDFCLSKEEAEELDVLPI